MYDGCEKIFCFLLKVSYKILIINTCKICATAMKSVCFILLFCFTKF